MGSQHRDASLEEWKELLDKFTDQKAMFDAIPLAASVALALTLTLTLALPLTKFGGKGKQKQVCAAKWCHAHPLSDHGRSVRRAQRLLDDQLWAESYMAERDKWQVRGRG